MLSSRSLAFAGLSAALLCLGGCGKSPPAAPGEAKRISIGVIAKATTHSYWKLVQAGVQRASAELGVDIEWQGPLDDSKVADQIGIFNNLAAGGVAGIVLSPTDDKALAPHVRTAAKRGLPIVIIDSPLDARLGSDYLSFIATDNTAAGATGGETLIRLVGDAPTYGGRTLVIRFTEGSASTRLREEGFLGKLRGSKLEVVGNQYSDGSMAGAQRVAEVLLNSYVKNNRLELDGIFASNQPTAEGAYNAVKSLRDKGVEVRTKFVGFDDSDLLRQGLRNGVITALVFQDPEKMGYLGVKTIVDAINHKPYEQHVDTGVTVKTRADLD